MGYPFHERWRHREYLVRFQPRMLILRLCVAPRHSPPLSVRRFVRAPIRETGTEIGGGPRGCSKSSHCDLCIKSLRAGLLRRRDRPRRARQDEGYAVDRRDH